ncbi:hypothetical protein M406DRAFT_328086 [Cryphonectria parasitica EP155]|uniref:Uncharacterized protein n=1 Tax=Cryphonectria parasitica (strain ATCC 38755 / EP155) TaxID=660469 RepID=A0A9P4Y5P2_CRYP1|nr:uncharacterized protein M406DRAFT_328086 [Cryphonectria parasitica EP155]KAF3766975.1 hypothetical protein M406DRAFT_328086 [Cryphonectria parasitica EP155]
MDSYSNQYNNDTSISQEGSNRMDGGRYQDNNFSSGGMNNDDFSSNRSSSRREREDDAFTDTQSSGRGNESFSSGIGQQDRRMPGMSVANENFGTGNAESRFESSADDSNEYSTGSGHNNERSSSGYGGQKESFGDKMIDKAAQFAKKEW